ncbi:hypothetical protein A3Q56_04409, partial [Intoshia linei]
LLNENTYQYILVDSLVPVKIIFSLSAVCYWYDQFKDEKEKGLQRDSKYDINDTVIIETAHVKMQPLKYGDVRYYGHLSVNRCDWTAVSQEKNIFTIDTTGVSSYILDLKPGLHVLKIFMSSPISYNLIIASSHNFAFCDEDKESAIYKSVAEDLVLSIQACMQNYNDLSNYQKIFNKLVDTHMPFKNIANMRFSKYYYLFVREIYKGVRQVYQDSKLFNSKMSFAWRCLFEDFYNSTVFEAETVTVSLNSSKAQNANIFQKPKTSINSDANIEHESARVIQKVWKGFMIRRMISSRKIGTRANKYVSMELKKSCNLLDSNKEKIGLTIYNNFIKSNRNIIKYYPFGRNVWNKISFVDFNGISVEQSPSAWFVVARYKIDNGYSILIETVNKEMAFSVGKWKLRIIGNHSDLPLSKKSNEMNSSFQIREFRDYYVPNESNVLMRYIMKVKEDCLLSIRFKLSNKNAVVRFRIYHNDNVVVERDGRGSVLVDAVLLKKPFVEESNIENDHKTASKPISREKLNSSSKLQKKISSRSSSIHSGSVIQDSKLHKYVIQVYVDPDSWELNDEEMENVEKINLLNKQETMVFQTENDKMKPSATKNLKDRKSGIDRNISKINSKANEHPTYIPAANAIELQYSHWNMCIVLDLSSAEDIEFIKDTERIDYIKTTKRMWEEAEPGRSLRASNIRCKWLEDNNYLKSQVVNAVTLEPIQVDSSPDFPIKTITQKIWDDCRKMLNEKRDKYFQNLIEQQLPNEPIPDEKQAIVHSPKHSGKKKNSAKKGKKK